MAFWQHIYNRLYTPSTRGTGVIVPIKDVWMGMDRRLRHLLAADVMARFGSYAAEYLVLYIVNIFGGSPLDFGLLVSLQMTTSILGYLPAAKMADIYGRRPFITLTFTFFSLYTLALALTHQEPPPDSVHSSWAEGDRRACQEGPDSRPGRGAPPRADHRAVLSGKRGGGLPGSHSGRIAVVD